MRMAYALLCVVTLLPGCSTAATTPVSAERGIPEAIACFPDAWNRRDMNAFGRCFAADADFVNVTGTWWKGRAAIQKNHAFLLGTMDQSDTVDITLPPQAYGIFKATTLTFKATELRALRPDIAIARISWQITGDARTPQPRTGLLMFVLTAATGGSWQITAVQNTEIQRPVK